MTFTQIGLSSESSGQVTPDNEFGSCTINKVVYILRGHQSVKVASSSLQAAIASSLSTSLSAFQHLLANLQSYLRRIYSVLPYRRQLQLITKFQNIYSDKVPLDSIASSLIFILISIFIISMSSWARSFWGSKRSKRSPFGSRSSAPNVTEDDYSYITSKDIAPPARTYDPARKSTPSSCPKLEDDVLLARTRSGTFSVKFPANSIFRGKLEIKDVKERLVRILDLPEGYERNIKLLYQGQEMKDDSRPCRDYGLETYSEITCIVNNSSNHSEYSGDGSESVESTREKRRRGRKVKKANLKNGANFSQQDATARSNPEIPAKPRIQGPIERLTALSSHFRTSIMPLCEQFISSPPEDAKKKDFEHKKLSETIMNEVLLKLDAVETEGNNEAREERRALVREVQGVLNDLDNTL